jgi:low affinity Fe/Cu permease
MTSARQKAEPLLERVSQLATQWAGSSRGFAAAAATVVLWALTGPVFHYSDTWQLVINTGTTVITFLMVFLIQRSQNKESRAVQLKLNELVAALQGASNRLLNAEELTEKELTTLRHHYEKLSQMAKKEGSLTESHSIEEAEKRHHVKSVVEKRRR